MATPELSERVRDWQARGFAERFRDHEIHVFKRDGEGLPLLLLHGFPSSSFDWRGVLDALPEPPVLAFDFLGFGLSEKPRDHLYTLSWQADLTEELVARHLDGGPVFLVAHDMGTSVTTELLRRDLEGELGFELAGVLLFDGNMVLERGQLRLSQKLLRSRVGPLFARLSNERAFRQQFGGVFSKAHPITDTEAADQWALLCHNGGRAMGDKLIYYLHERAELIERWRGAIRDWDGELSFAWGVEDPVSPVAVLEALCELRPAAPVERLEGLGHYPQVEDPETFAGVIRRALDR